MTEMLDAITAIAILTTVSMGLLTILGLMDVINLAHPGFMAVGGYAVLKTTEWGLNPWLAVVVAAVVTGAIGGVVEWGVVRRLYHRPLDTILATWGIALVIWQALALLFGRAAHPYDGPIQDVVDLGVFSYSGYRLFLIAFAAVLVVSLVVIQRHTRVGLIARAVMANPSLARGLGVNTRKVQFVTFVVGAAMAGTAGALLAPLFPVNPYMGLPYLIPAFLAVLLAGKTVGGLVLGAILLSGGQTLVATLMEPVVAGVVMALIAVAILRFLPDGFVSMRRLAGLR